MKMDNQGNIIDDEDETKGNGSIMVGASIATAATLLVSLF